MLHTRSEEKTRKFSARSQKTLNKYAEEISRAKGYEAIAEKLRTEARAALVDIFYVISDPASAAYHVPSGPLKGKLLCLDMGVRYKADMGKLAKKLGDRIKYVTVEEPVFKTDKAKAALAAGIITEEELALCVTATPTLAAQIREPSDGHAPKGIEEGEAKVTPLKLAKGVRLQWG